MHLCLSFSLSVPPSFHFFSLLDVNLSYWHVPPSSSTTSAAKTRPVIAEPEIHGSQSLDSVTGFLLLMSEGLINALESAHGPEQANQVRGFILTVSTTFPLLVFPSSFYNLCINVSPPSFGKPPTQNHTIYIFVLSNSFLSCSSLPSYASAFHPFHWYHLCVYIHCPFLNSEACFSRPLLVRVSIAVIFRSLIVFISITLLGLLFFYLLFLLLFFLLVLEL